MPFGSNVKTLILTEPWDWSATRQPKTRRVKVPEVEAPWWWSEYLTEEWKRRNGCDRPSRDTRTGLQKAEDEWALTKHRWSENDPHFADRPRDSIWGVAPDRQKAG